MTSHREVDVGEGLSLHAEIDGEGSPVVLLHGFTGSAITWQHLTRRLQACFTTVAVDLPGHGSSTCPSDPSRYALPRLATDLGRLLDVIGLDRVAMLGYSLGGRAALHFALHQPSRLSALVLESTSSGIDDPGELQARKAADAELADFIDREGVEAFVDKWERLPLWSSQAALPAEAREALHAQRLANVSTGLAGSLRGAGAGAMGSVSGRLGDIHAPTLLIAGALDQKYVDAAQSMKRSIPRSELTIINDAGHAPHLERPEELAQVVEEFLLRQEGCHSALS